MAITSVGSLGAASGYDFGSSTLALSPTSDVPAGDLVVVWATWTSYYFFGPNGEQIPEMACMDNAGNLYVQLVNTYRWDAYVAMYASQLRNDLHTTDTITLQHRSAGAKAASLWQFELTPGKRWAFYLDNIATTGVTSGDPQALSIGSLDSAREHLLLHVLGAQGPNTDAYTWDSDYTRIDDAGTTGHGIGGAPPSTEDVHVRGGFRIVSGITGDTVDVTSTTADRDNDQAIVAVVELDQDEDFPDFPNTPLLDDFNRADENPVDGGIWDKTGIHPQFGSNYVKIVSNQATSSSGSGGGSEYMLEELFTENGSGEYEEWATLAVASDAVLGFGAGNGNANTVGATGVTYRVSSFRATVAQVSIGDTTFSGEMPSGVNVLVWGALANGSKIGIQQLTADIWTQHLWMDVGAGWEWVAASIRSSGSSFITDGFFSLALNTTTRLDDFGGGILERALLPQIIRRLPI